MKKMLYMALLPLVLTGCRNGEKFGESDITIRFVAPSLAIDLNVTTNPPVVGVVSSVNPLRSVTMYIIKGDAEEQFGDVITDFRNPKNYSVSQTPVYREDMTGFRIVACDMAGEEVERTLLFDITSVKNAPEIVFSPENVVVTEGAPVPAITATVVGAAPLAYVRITKVINRVETPVIENITSFDVPDEYLFDIAEFATEYIFIPGITSLKIEAADTYGKIRIASLAVQFVELPKPVIVFNQTQPVAVDEFEPLTISGMATSYAPMSHITISIIGADSAAVQNYDVAEDVYSHNFSHTITSVAADYQAVSIAVTDALGKRTCERIALDVTAYPAPVIAAPVANYFGIETTETISLIGNVVTSSPALLTNVTISKRTMAGVTSVVVDDDISTEQYTPSLSFSPEETLAAIIIVATNAKGKTTTLEIPVTVGFYLLENLKMGPQTTDGQATSTYNTPCFFSSVLRRFVTLEEGFANPSIVDWGLGVASGGTAKVYQLTHQTELQSRYKHAVYGMQLWDGFPSAFNVSKIKGNVSGVNSAANFATYTATNLKTPTDASLNAVSDYFWQNDAVRLVLFETVERDGKVQRGLIYYNGFDDSSAVKEYGIATTNRATFSITIKLTTPYTK